MFRNIDGCYDSWDDGSEEISRTREVRMRQELTTVHNTHPDGTPTGGRTSAVGLEIEWQNGPFGKDAGRAEPNGCLVETVILAAIERLEYYQGSRFACRENAEAITKLDEAIGWLHTRTADRESRHVEGTHIS
jgi:hypothetical protein